MEEEYRQRERILQYVLDAFGTEPEYPWAGSPHGAVLRHQASKKWYGLLMRVDRGRLGLPAGGTPGGSQTADVLNLKCGPLLLGSLLAEPGFLPAYHMNKTNWVSILLDGPVEDEAVFPLLGLSYDSAAPKPRKRKARPAGEEES